MTTIASDHSATTETEDRLAILELIGRLALSLDGKDWDGLERLFTDPVHVDRTSLWGGDPETYSPGELAGGFRQTMGNLDAIHHLITGHVISLDGDDATCAANMQGVHVFANASGGPMNILNLRRAQEAPEARSCRRWSCLRRPVTRS